MKKKLGAILLVVALALSLGLVPAASVGASPDTIWTIGNIDGNASGFGTNFPSNSATYNVGDALSGFPSRLHTSDYTTTPWVNQGVNIVTISFTTTAAYANVSLDYYRMGGETDQVWFGSTPLGTCTGTTDPQSSTLYTFLVPGIVVAGAYTITIQCTGPGVGDGSHLIDALQLTGTPVWDVTVNAEEDSNSLAVPIPWAWDGDGNSGTDTTSFPIEDILDSSSLTLTAPMTHTESYTFYVFDYWSVDGTDYDDPVVNPVTFDVTEDLTATAHYTKVISVDKTLDRCYKLPLVDTVEVPADSASGATSTTPLESGKTYILEVSGTFDAAAGITADAEYSSGPTSYVWQEPVEKYESYGVNLLDLKVDGAFVDWGPYDSSHVYTLLYPGTGSTVSFLIYDLAPYSNNSGFLTVDIYELVDCNAVPLGEVVSFGMTITVHAYEDVTEVYVEDGIGADLVVDDWEASSGEAHTFEPGKGKGKGKNKMSATKIGWTIGDPEVCEDYTLDIVVHTGFNPKDKQEYTSTGPHELNSGPEVWFTYDGTPLYMLQGPPVSVNVVDDEG